MSNNLKKRSALLRNKRSRNVIQPSAGPSKNFIHLNVINLPLEL